MDHGSPREPDTNFFQFPGFHRKRVFDYFEIPSLHQGFRSVADYSIRFHIFEARSGWNDAALAEALKDELASREESGDLETLISMVIRLDNRLWERLQ